MRIVDFVFLSDHFHMLLLPESPQQLAKFMGYFASNVAREIGRAHDWREKFWSKRYTAILVSNEEAAQVARLHYLLAQGVKEGLVASPGDWPGPNGVAALLEGRFIEGTWWNRTAEAQARRKGLELSPRQFASTETVTLTPLPCWLGWTEERRLGAIRDIVAQIERHAKLVRTRPVLGRNAILKQDPHALPWKSKHEQAPAFHAATKAVRQTLRDAYRAFARAFWRASELLRAGVRSVQFPPGSFPPALPYVPIRV